MRKNKKDERFSLDEEFIQTNFGKSDSHHPDALTADEILNTENDSHAHPTALNSLLKKMTHSEEEVKAEEAPSEKEAEASPAEKKSSPKSLLDKCMPFILDDNGEAASSNSEPLYKLASVAEILNADSKRTLEKLSREYGMVFEDITPKKPAAEESQSAPPIEEIPFEKEAPVEPETPAEPEKPSATPVISDIDIPDSPFYKPESEPDISGGETVTFTPITYSGEKRSKIFVSTHTKPIDFTDELIKVSAPQAPETEEVQLEESEFEEYIPKKEFIDEKSGKELLKEFIADKKFAFFSMWGSIILTLVTAIFMLPVMSDVLLTYTRVCMSLTGLLILLGCALNFKIFLSIPKIFTKKSSSDVSVSLAAISVLLYTVFGIVTGEIALDMQIYIQVFLMLILSFSSIKSFMRASYFLRSFRQIYHKGQKNAVALLNDPAITMAMTKGSVEGDCLITAPQGSAHISDFMKYATYGKFLGGRNTVISVASLVIAIVMGFIAGAFANGWISGLYAASAVLCLTALPTLCFIDVLPLYSAAKKLAVRGAMIAGMAGAETVEQSNAVVLNAKDIFPSGTVSMHRMQVLSENNLEDTIVRAASLTEALQSPLAPIFKKIAGTGNITVFPDSDTVKYEEALGISGWVDNRLLFIGNRTLLEAHGISVPDVEIDRKILREGYFPVYVADQNKACAMIVIKYEVDPHISKELNRLSANGITMLIKTSDPNLTEEMICDYFGLYEDSVKVMTAAGCHIYVNTVTPVKSVSCPAAFKTGHLALPTILNCAGRIMRSNLLLTAAYIISAVFGILLFAYASFGGGSELLSGWALLIYGAVTTAISYLLYLTQKP